MSKTAKAFSYLAEHKKREAKLRFLVRLDGYWRTCQSIMMKRCYELAAKDFKGKAPPLAECRRFVRLSRVELLKELAKEWEE